MDLPAFKQSLDRDAPPEDLGRALAASGTRPRATGTRRTSWPRPQGDAESAWVHAYLHRVEGNPSNADHWYRRAGKPPSSAPLKQEWDEIAGTLLGE